MANYKTILVVDDDPGMREVITYSMTMDGYKVLSSPNGKEALELLAECERPGLILLDMRMPIMDGYKFLEIFGNDPALNTIPVVVMSADAEDSRIKGAVAFLNKPFVFQTLLEVLKRHSL